MAVDFFLKVEGVKGEARDKTHTEEIDVISWSWGLMNSGTMHIGGGGGAGKVSIQDLTVTKYVDKATPNMIDSCTTGKHFPNAVLYCRKASGDSPIEYLKIRMEDVLITNISHGGSDGEERLTENVTLNFAKVEVAYTEQKPDGSAGPEVVQGWNIEENAKL